MNDPVYKGFRRDEMEFQFNPRVTVPDYARFHDERNRVSTAARRNLKSYPDIFYGKSPRSTLDIFPADKPGSPVLLYIHGGYWRGGKKSDHSFIAGAFVKAGVTVVILEYDLCPAVTVTDIVRQALAGVAWVFRNISEYGGDPSRLYISGSSAGGHLVAMALAHDWEKSEGLPPDFIKGAVAITGVYDLDPVIHVSVNEDIRLNPESARRNSPMVHPPLLHTPIVIAVGQDESPGWKQMSQDYFTLCKERSMDCRYLVVPGANHFSISMMLGDSGSAVSRAIHSQMGL